MRLLQKVVIVLNVKPFTYVFHVIYWLGLKVLLAALSRHRTIHSVFGSGSFFLGRCLYGLSDIDLILVIRPEYSRTDAEPYQIRKTYNHIQRIFPFLGNWSEKAENIIFLSDMASGFPAPESFRIRAKQNSLVLLHGEPFPAEYVSGEISITEITAEINTLLRMAITKGEMLTSNLLFWKRIFTKILHQCELLGYTNLAQQLRINRHLDFLDGNEISLYIKKSWPEILFPLLLNFVQQVYDEIALQERMTTCTLTPVSGEKPPRAFKTVHSEKSLPPVVEKIHSAVLVKPDWVYAPLCGLLPNMNYFKLDEYACIIRVKFPSYGNIRQLIKILAADDNYYQPFLVQVKGLLFVMNRLPSYVDIVALDPVVYGNLYAQVIHGSHEFTWPHAVNQEQKATADKMFLALSQIYDDHEGWVKKLSFPCFYSEDDKAVIEDAFHRMRVYLLHQDNIDITSHQALIRRVGGKYPSCRPFLNDLLAYYRFLEDGTGSAEDIAGNLFRCLHQFMVSFLRGDAEIVIDDHRKRLGITVGIITRNRSSDLEDVLMSLTSQFRPADEVLVVDNGSTDNTREAIRSYEDRLPISYYFLPDASIPNARNMVLDNARHDIISFTDDDCIVEAQWLQAVERAFLRADNIGMVGGWVKHAAASTPGILDTYYSLFHHNKT